MPRKCLACSSPSRAAIDEAVTRGESFRRIAPRYGVSDRALRRHAAEHVPDAIVKAREAAEVTRADDLLELLRGAVDDARRLRQKAEDEGDYRGAIGAVKALSDVVETLANIADRLARAENMKPPAPTPVLTDGELAGAIEMILRAAAREEVPRVN